MSHKKTNSLSSIPFSWEMIPGVPKFMASQETTVKALPAPPPGCFRQPVMKRSVSARIFWREEDPFLAALKECSKDYKVKGDEMKKRYVGIGNKVWGRKSFFWCRSTSFDVEEGNLGWRPAVPPASGGPATPRERVQGLVRVQKGMRK